MSNGGLSKEAVRLVKAFGHAASGLKSACGQPAFRIELLLALVLVPAALFTSETATERSLMIGSVMLVLIVELLNTGIETAIDRVSTEWHPLSKLAKDVGSAAVLLSLVNAGIIWLILLIS